MAEEVRAEPDAIVRLAKATLASADAMSGAWSAAPGAVVPGSDAFGDSAGSAALASAIATAEAATDAAWRRIVQVCEDDTDKLYRVAFAYQQADAEAFQHGKQPLK